VPEEAQIVLASYNHLVALMPPHPTKVYSMARYSKANFALAEAIYDYLADEIITPMAYLASCFAKHAWCFRPALSKLLSARYQTYFAEHQSDSYLWAAVIRHSYEAQQPVLVSAGTEIVKSRLISEGGHSHCRSRPELSSGCNTDSPLCRKCPLREECACG